jgi:DNA-binding CsgD family transcriptional regulator
MTIQTSTRLPSDQYARVFDVLERCDAARTLGEFKELVLESLGSAFSYRHLTCFAGPSLKEVFADRSPSLRGSCAVSWPGYRDRWHQYDLLSSDEACRILRRDGFADIDQLRAVPAWGRDYIDGHMRPWGYRSSAAIHLEFPYGGHALVGLTDPEPGLINPVEASALRLLSRHLYSISRRMTAPPADTKADAVLSDRLREVAALVCDGRSNKEIAATLFLSLDTVKKYVSRILATTGSRSRAEFMARYSVTAPRTDLAGSSASS